MCDRKTPVFLGNEVIQEKELAINSEWYFVLSCLVFP